MLENIKLMLGSMDSSKDELILLYIKKVSTDVLSYCNLDELPTKLEGFVENKVYTIMKSHLSVNQGVKSVSMGDTKMDYIDTSTSIDITSTDKATLNTFRRLRAW